MVRSLLTATSLSWAQVVLLPQPPKHLGLQRQVLSLSWSARANHHLLQHGPPRRKQSSCLSLQKLDCKYLPPCPDLDECENGETCCAQLCISYLGGYECSCQEGFQISSDGCGCDDADECLDVSIVVTNYINPVGTYECSVKKATALEMTEKLPPL
ncbi:growth arrest-specific protein 6-like [Aotus nancymaae]|uniref:growth arrest-specific protein 6-like n=1 Tax=Aotus nancymaae TaxID=37293 RepID=UPI0030FE972B